jgi:hypothetical protein
MSGCPNSGQCRLTRRVTMEAMSGRRTKLRRNNHYLAECYQRGFTDHTGHLWFKESDKQPVYRNPGSVGRQRNLYIRNVNGLEDDRIETFLDREVENSFAGISQRVKTEREKFETNVSIEDASALLRFIASQAVRTLGHRQCVDTQAGRPVEKHEFHRTMFRLMRAMCDHWGKNPPYLKFVTTLPFVGEHFITGDSPVLILQIYDNAVWAPVIDPELRITQLSDILNSPKHEITLPLSPYVAVVAYPRIGPAPSSRPQTVEPSQVRKSNNLLRGQSKIFTIARDKESLK